MNDIHLEQRKAIVTGGARGIGYAIAERLLKSGAAVSLWDRDAAALESAAKTLSQFGVVHIAPVQLTNAASIEDAIQSTLQGLGKLDILVNNAGIAGVNKKTWELTPEEWSSVVEIDLNAVFLMCRAVVPHLLRNGYGRIINMASIAGKEGNPNAAHYSAAKAGVIALTKSLGKELAQSNITVNCITPAVIQTDILKQCTEQHINYMLSKIPMGRFGKVDEAASMVAWLSSEECSFTTAAVFDLSGGRATY